MRRKVIKYLIPSNLLPIQNRFQKKHLNNSFLQTNEIKKILKRKNHKTKNKKMNLKLKTKN